MGRERLLEMLLAGTPDRLVSAMVASCPEDAAEVARLREELALLAHVPAPVRPPPALRERILRVRPRRPERPALLVIDMLNDHLTPGRPIEIPRARAVVPALAARLAGARARSIPVIYVCDSHAPDDEDFREWPPHAVEGTPGAEVWPALAPQPGDHVLRKRTYSAFTGTELGPLLDRLGADELVLTGCATEVQVAATAMEALQRGFVVTIPPDSQAGASELAEQVTMLTLGVMPPFEPRYLRR
ncbi:MAG: cysteine hydrolase [Polyangiaceae bacterium]|nr:cysteine hydrolase [Polyangiaceae bacterium]